MHCRLLKDYDVIIQLVILNASEEIRIFTDESGALISHSFDFI